MKYTETQLKHINNILNKDGRMEDMFEDNLQLDVKYDKINGIDVARIHVATKEEVVYDDWEQFMENKDKEIDKRIKKNRFKHDVVSIMTIMFFVLLSFAIWLFSDSFKNENEILIYGIVAIAPMIIYFFGAFIQNKISNKFYTNFYKEINNDIKKKNSN